MARLQRSRPVVVPNPIERIALGWLLAFVFSLAVLADCLLGF